MEEILDLYQQPPDPAHPLICFDESHKEQQAETRPPVAAAPGQVARYDHEYTRHGMSSLHLMFAPHANWRSVAVTDGRGGEEFAHCMVALVDEHFPAAEWIDLVVDNLNTHTKASLYAHLPPTEAHRVARKLHFHYTPKHGSWLNMAEIELSVLRRQALAQRLEDQEQVRAVVEAWAAARNAAEATVRWQFTTVEARIKLERLYPCIEHD
jgi:hypothetical protein